MNMETNYYALASELFEVKKLLAEKENELKAIKDQRERRAESAKRNRRIDPKEKEFGAILRASNRRLKSQEYKSPVTLNRIIKKGIMQSSYGEYSFFSILNNRISRLKCFTPFIDDCNVYNLNPNVVAQHVVSRGEEKNKLVFKDGLIQTFGKDELLLMGKPIFSEEELDLSQYAPDEFSDSVDTE